jgi:hypothetical protein
MRYYENNAGKILTVGALILAVIGVIRGVQWLISCF